ncbi:hypothetical protein [Lysinibacillus sphaericus]|uniref:hypothetical protein n=1 Tax=Lysinibacillus sphaericus TaxID=1421 RepID=UPI003D7FE7B4
MTALNIIQKTYFNGRAKLLDKGAYSKAIARHNDSKVKFRNGTVRVFNCSIGSA